MSNSPGIVEGEWDDQPHNQRKTWRAYFKRWRRSKELFRFEAVRTEAMSADDFFVIGRATEGRVQEGDAVIVDVGEQSISTRVTSIDHAVQNDEEFHMLMALKLEGIGPDSGIVPGTVIRQPG
ncbi:hypothetical protein [Candidatus Poriferisocius sp.]|uniref:hypothetical protein n=1 Tax=Candidatus Poriferisocius sp. TaxID=3101276 RepID=UPI003B010CA0